MGHGRLDRDDDQGAGIRVQLLSPLDRLPGAGNLRSVTFDTPSPENLIADAGLTARLDLQITWAVYDPLVASIPVEGAQIAVVTGGGRD